MHRLLTGPLSVESHTLSISGLPKRLDGFVIVQLSDFHFDGVRLSNRLLSETVRRVQAINPDLIALTGDFVTNDPSPIYELAAQIKYLPSRYGMVAVLGNHDIYAQGAKETVTKGLEEIGVSVLWNAIALPMGDDFPVVGLADYWSGEFDPTVLDQLDAQTPRLVLSHNPDTAEILAKWRADLVLSGHTHGGQSYIPLLGPGPLVWRRIRQWVPSFIRNRIPFLSDRCFKVLRHWEWARGLHKVGENWLYVNRGLGTYFPGRFFCSPEITVITLVKA